MRLLIRNARLLWAAAQVIQEQRRLIATLEADKEATELAYMRIGKDLIEQFLIALDKPEDSDIFRARLSKSLIIYRDEIAVREEHA